MTTSGSSLTAYWGVKSALKCRSKRRNLHDGNCFVAADQHPALNYGSSRYRSAENPRGSDPHSAETVARLRAYPNRSVFEVGCEVDERQPRSRGLARETSAQRQKVHQGKREKIMSDDPQRFLIRTVVVLVCALGGFRLSAARDAVARTFLRHEPKPPRDCQSRRVELRALSYDDGPGWGAALTSMPSRPIRLSKGL